MKSKIDPEVITIGGVKVQRGENRHIELLIARLYDFTELSIPVYVIRAKEPGPVFFLSGAVHGDEIIGPEIIKRLLNKKRFKLIRGTLICIPIVNVFGFNSRSRYLPDRRDLNRCFPGSQSGSLAGRLAHIFLKQIVSKSHYGIDLHSAAVHRSNLPQIRACLDNPLTEKLALVFGAPVIIDSKIRDGSLRGTAEKKGVSILVFEGGEALRHDENVIKVALKGIHNCLSHLGMIKEGKKERINKKAVIAKSSYWIRAPQSGMMRSTKTLGTMVEKNERLAKISDVFAKNTSEIITSTKGVIIGETRLPLVNQGDALFHIAVLNKSDIGKLPEDLIDYVDE